MENNGKHRKNAPSNEEYREILTKNAFEMMKSNQIEYAKQSHVYVPQSMKISNLSVNK